MKYSCISELQKVIFWRKQTILKLWNWKFYCSAILNSCVVFSFWLCWVDFILCTLFFTFCCMIDHLLEKFWLAILLIEKKLQKAFHLLLLAFDTLIRSCLYKVIAFSVCISCQLTLQFNGWFCLFLCSWCTGSRLTYSIVCLRNFLECLDY